MGSEDRKGSCSKVWVAGLPFDIRQRDVVALISEFADIEVRLPDNKHHECMLSIRD